MNRVNARSVLIVSILLASSSASAETVIGCPPGWTSAFLSLTATATWSFNGELQPSCPLLEERSLRKLVDDLAVGTTFAHPLQNLDPEIPWDLFPTCLSGTIETGALAVETRVYDIDALASFTESAQRLFPVPGGQDLFGSSSDGTLQAGAAMTLLHLEGMPQSSGVPLKIDILVDDHFLLNQSGVDAEDFNVIGSKGTYDVLGRISAQGQVLSPFPLAVYFEINSDVCVKWKR